MNDRANRNKISKYLSEIIVNNSSAASRTRKNTLKTSLNNIGQQKPPKIQSKNKQKKKQKKKRINRQNNQPLIHIP